MKRRILLAVALVALTTPALADEYYIVQNPTTSSCHIDRKT